MQGYPHLLGLLVVHINHPHIPEALQWFLYDHVNPDADVSPANINIEECPDFTGRILVYHSAIARFFAPSDLCGAGGMYCEQIHSHPDWQGKYVWYDTMFVKTGSELDPMHGMTIGCALLFFSLTFRDEYLPCALIQWLVPSNVPNENTGMWVVQSEFTGNGHRTLSVIYIDCVARAAHLLPIYRTSFIPEDLQFLTHLMYFIHILLTTLLTTILMSF